MLGGAKFRSYSFHSSKKAIRASVLADTLNKERLHSRKLTWKPNKGPIKTTVLLKGDYMGFHVSLGECKSWSVGMRV